MHIYIVYIITLTIAGEQFFCQLSHLYNVIRVSSLTTLKRKLRRMGLRRHGHNLNYATVIDVLQVLVML